VRTERNRRDTGSVFFLFLLVSVGRAHHTHTVPRKRYGFYDARREKRLQHLQIEPEQTRVRVFQRQDVRVVGFVLRRWRQAGRFQVGGRPVAVHVARQRFRCRLVPGAPVARRDAQAYGRVPPRQPAPQPPPRRGVQEFVAELAVQPAESRQIVVVVLVAAQSVVHVVAEHVSLEAGRQAQTVAHVQVQRQQYVNNVQ